MQPEEAVQIKDRTPGNTDRWSHGVIGRFAMGHDDVQTVGGAALENDNQAFVLRTRRDGSLRRTREKRGQGGGAYDGEGPVLHKYAACDRHKSGLLSKSRALALLTKVYDFIPLEPCSHPRSVALAHTGRLPALKLGRPE